MFLFIFPKLIYTKLFQVGNFNIDIRIKGMQKDKKNPVTYGRWKQPKLCEHHQGDLLAKEKYRGMFEIQKSGNKTSSGEIGLDIKTHASPKVGQDQVSAGVI